MPISTGKSKSFINSRDFRLLRSTAIKVNRIWCTKCGNEVLIPEDHICSADKANVRPHRMN